MDIKNKINEEMGGSITSIISRFRLHGVFLAVVLLWTPLCAGDELADERPDVRAEIAKNYPRLNKLEGGKHGYRRGLVDLVATAVQMGVFHEGQGLREAVLVFSESAIYRKEWMVAKLDDGTWLLIPLQTHYLPVKGLFTVGSQWYLSLKVGEDLMIEGIRMEYRNPKKMTLRGVEEEGFEESELAKKLGLPKG